MPAAAPAIAQSAPTMLMRRIVERFMDSSLVAILTAAGPLG